MLEVIDLFRSFYQKSLPTKQLVEWLELVGVLVVEQLNGSYRVRSADMKPLHARVNECRQHFALVTFQHVRRERNQEADRLVNEALDGKRRPGFTLVAAE